MIARGGTVQTKQTFSGSDLSGVDGADGRVLTLNNTKITAVVDVTIDNTLIEDYHYTVSHQAIGTTITFVSGFPIWNDQKGEVIYE